MRFLRKYENFPTKGSKYNNLKEKNIVMHTQFLLTKLAKFEKFVKQKKLWSKNKKSISLIFDKFSLHQLKFDLWLRKKPDSA